VNFLFLSDSEACREWDLKESIDESHFTFKILPKIKLTWFKRRFTSDLIINYSFIKYLKDVDAILVTGYNYPTYWLMLLYCKIFNIPIILFCESTLLETGSLNPLIIFFKRFFINSCKIVLVPGKSSYNYIRKMQLKNSHSIEFASNSVDNNYFQTRSVLEDSEKRKLYDKYQIKPTSTVFLFVGRLAEEKGLFNLINAFALLKKTENDCHLLILGDGPLRPLIEQQVQSKGIKKYTTLAGFIQKNTLASFYGISDILVVPSYSEPWGLVVNEALACGLPIIASDKVGCAVDLVTNENGLIFESGNENQLYNSLVYMLEADLISMGKASRKIISKYTPEIQAKQIVNTLLSVSGKSINEYS